MSEIEDHSIFLISGERSGDLHALELLGALEGQSSSYTFHGMGGSHLVAEYGENFEDWAEEAAVIGITEVLKKYPWFKRKFAETLSKIETLNPAAVILVDYPGFNLRIAKALRKRGYQGKICYYISPQVWAWNRGRIPKMAKLLDLMLCVFEFEKELYEDSGLETVWVGHPMVEELEERRVEIVRRPHLVGLFPGSRRREIRSLLPEMIASAKQVQKLHPQATFELAVASEVVMPLVKEILSTHQAGEITHFKLVIGESHRLMQEASAAWIASGTATLEAGYYGLPYALVYRVSSLTYWIAKRVVKIPYIGMVNVLADKFVVQEFIQDHVTKEHLTKEMIRLLEDHSYTEQMKGELRRVKEMLGGGGVHLKAAQALHEFFIQ